MDKKTRRALFYGSAIIFLVLSYLAVLIATGYIFDFKNFKFVKTGTLALKTDIRGANIYIKNKKVGAASAIYGSFSKKYLLPGIYDVSIKKSGYYNWSKKVEIKSQEVTNFASIILIQENPARGLLNSNDTENVSNELKSFEKEELEATKQILNEFLSLNKYKLTAKVSPDRKKIAYFRDINELTVFWTENQEFEPRRKKEETQLIVRLSVPINNFFWFKDSEHLIYSTPDRVFLTELEPRGGINTFEILALNKDEKIIFSKNKEIFFSAEDKIYSLKF